jgi:hypothetical protein
VDVIHLLAQEKPFIVKVIEPPGDPTGIADTVIGAIGLAGAMALLALLAGIIVGGALYWIRSRRPLE